MSDITIMVRNAATGSTVEVELPDDAQMKDLLPILAEKLQICDPGKLRLKNKAQNFEYNDTDTLAGRVTKHKDLCVLSLEPEWGGSKK